MTKVSRFISHISVMGDCRGVTICAGNSRQYVLFYLPKNKSVHACVCVRECFNIVVILVFIILFFVFILFSFSNFFCHIISFIIIIIISFYKILLQFKCCLGN